MRQWIRWWRDIALGVSKEMPQVIYTDDGAFLAEDITGIQIALD